MAVTAKFAYQAGLDLTSNVAGSREVNSRRRSGRHRRPERPLGRLPCPRPRPRARSVRSAQGRTRETGRSGSDNLIRMPEVSATDAARNFADLLDAIEHRGEHFTIVRRGKAIAHLEPASRGRGADVKVLLRRHRTDPEWAGELHAIRELVELQTRP